MRGAAKLALPLMVAGAMAGCKSTAGASATKDLDGSMNADGSGTGAVEWPCLSRRFGATAENARLTKQDEYCEWQRTKKPDDTATYCEFTVSMWNHDDFYLRQQNNTLQAAIALISDCEADAKKRLAADPSDAGYGQGVASVGGNDLGVPTRNSDPKICDEIRLLTQKKANGQTYQIVDLDPAGLGNPPAQYSEMALMKLGPLLTDESQLPTGCAWGRKNNDIDKRYIFCKLNPGQQCGTGFGARLNVGFLVNVAAPAASPDASTPNGSTPDGSTPDASAGLVDNTELFYAGSTPLSADTPTQHRADAVTDTPDDDTGVVTLNPAVDPLPPAGL